MNLPISSGSLSDASRRIGNLSNSINNISPSRWEHFEEARRICDELQHIAGILATQRTSANNDSSGLTSTSASVSIPFRQPQEEENFPPSQHSSQGCPAQDPNAEHDDPPESRVPDSYDLSAITYSAQNPPTQGYSSTPMVHASRTPSEIATVCASTQHTLGTVATLVNSQPASRRLSNHQNNDLARASINSGFSMPLSQFRPRALLDDDEHVDNDSDNDNPSTHSSFVQETNLQDSFVQETNIEDSYVPETEFQPLHPSPLSPPPDPSHQQNPPSTFENDENETQDAFKILLSQDRPAPLPLNPPPRRQSTSSGSQENSQRSHRSGCVAAHTPLTTASNSKSVPSTCDIDRMFKKAFKDDNFRDSGPSSSTKRQRLEYDLENTASQMSSLSQKSSLSQHSLLSQSSSNGPSPASNALTNAVGVTVAPEHKIVALSYLLPPTAAPPSSLMDEFTLYSRKIVCYKLSDDIKIRTSAYVVPSFDVGGKNCTYRNYQYLLALAWGLKVVDVEGREIEGDEQFWGRIYDGNGGGEESRQVRNFWREVQRRSVENPVRFSQIKFTSPTKPFFHGWTFHLAASMSEAIQAERCLSEDECSCLIKSLGGKILSESEDDMESWHKKSIDKKVILIDDDVDDQDLLAEWGVISTLEGEGVIPADTEICLINEDAPKESIRYYLIRKVWLADAIAACKLPPMRCPEYSFGVMRTGTRSLTGMYENEDEEQDVEVEVEEEERVMVKDRDVAMDGAYEAIKKVPKRKRKRRSAD